MAINHTARNEDEGAVAIVVAIMMIVLLGISAFAVDFGLAYSNRRQLQTAADAAALAGARSFSDESVSCASAVASDGDEPVVTGGGKTYATMESEAEAAATSLMQANHDDAAEVAGSVDIECQGGAIQVTWANDSSSAVGLGGVFGAGDIVSTTEAVAALDVPPGVPAGLRPFPFCSKGVPTSGPLPSAIVLMRGPVTGGPAAQDPDCPKPGGNWWIANCPETTNNGTTSVVESIENGCSSAVEEAQPPFTPSGPPAAQGLLNMCPPNTPFNPAVPDDCLNSRTGNINNSAAGAWSTVIHRGDSIVVPVYCGSPQCSPQAALGSTITSGPGAGNPVNYPIYRLVAVRVCGFHFGNQEDQVPDPADVDDPCHGRPPIDSYLDPAYNANRQNYFQVAYTQLDVGSVTGASGCDLGDPSCDGGLRRTLLVG